MPDTTDTPSTTPGGFSLPAATLDGVELTDRELTIYLLGRQHGIDSCRDMARCWADRRLVRTVDAMLARMGTVRRFVPPGPSQPEPLGHPVSAEARAGLEGRCLASWD